MTDSKVDKESKSTDIEHKTAKKQNENQALTVRREDVVGTQKELDAALTYFDTHDRRRMTEGERPKADDRRRTFMAQNPGPCDGLPPPPVVHRAGTPSAVDETVTIDHHQLTPRGDFTASKLRMCPYCNYRACSAVHEVAPQAPIHTACSAVHEVGPQAVHPTCSGVHTVGQQVHRERSDIQNVDEEPQSFLEHGEPDRPSSTVAWEICRAVVEGSVELPTVEGADNEE